MNRVATTNRANRIEFDHATPMDDAKIRRLLRENPMQGEIVLSLEREPNYFFEATHADSEHQTIVGREGDRVVGVGHCTLASRFINGHPGRVGYLGGLRLDASVSGRFDILRRGYQYYEEWDRSTPADHYFTSIAADNWRAIQFFERGLRGLPTYEPAGTFVSLLLNVPRQARSEIGDDFPRFAEARQADLSEMVSCLNDHGRQGQFSCVWTEVKLGSLRSLGLRLSDWRTLRHQGRVVACGALWDQRSFKQSVIRGYSPKLRRLRPWVNLVAQVTGRVTLPAIDTTLAYAAVSPLAVGDGQQLVKLVASLFPLAREKGVRLLLLGLAANDPRLDLVRSSFAGHEYRSKLYSVYWPGKPRKQLDQRIPCPEVAWL